MSVADTPRLNLAAHFIDARIAEGRGDRPAVRAGDRIWVYSEIAAMTARIAGLLADADVRPEERVIIALPDGALFVGALFGVLRLGAVVVMVNPDLQPDLLTYFFDYTRARAVFVDRAHAGALEAAIGSISPTPKMFVLDDPEVQRRLEAGRADFSPFASHPDEAAIWLFSGGTTGRPKAVIQTNRSYVNTTERYGKGVLAMAENDITLAVPKLFFGYAMGSNVLFPFAVGASCVLFAERSTPEAIFQQIQQHRPTVLINVPTMVQQMVAHPAASEQDFSCLRLATSAGEALPAELYERWKHTFGVELLDGLGTAEMWHIFISNRPGAVVPGTLGHVVDGFEVKLCDAEGHEVPPGEVGALWVKGDSRAIGYWQRHDDTARAFRGEWYVSGDMLRQNADGSFVYCGRGDDMLKVGGKWLSPGELENCLLQHGGVREVAVVGVKNAAGLVKPCAFVVADTPSTTLAQDLQAFAKARLEPYKYPREVIFLDTLPRTHLGKVDRHALAKSIEGPDATERL